MHKQTPNTHTLTPILLQTEEIRQPRTSRNMIPHT